MSKNIDINNLGTFASIAAVWAAYPEGGQEGDYLYIGSVKYRWNKYNLLWESAATYTESDARKLTELYADVTVNNDLHVGGTLYYHRMKGYDLGLFSSLTSLQAAYPSPEVGMWAFVVHPSISGKYQLYACSTAGTWTLSVSETTLDVLDFERYEEALALMQELANGAQLSGYRAAEAVSDLPVTDVDPTLGWIVGNHLYVWVGEGGDVLDGKYKDCGVLRGAKGDKGDKGDNGVVLDPEAVTIFNDIDDLYGKTAAEKETYIPDGNITDMLTDRDNAVKADILPYTNLTGVGGNTILSSLSIDPDTKEVVARTGSDADKYKVSYTKGSLPKGSVLHFIGTPSTSTASRVWGWTTTNPADYYTEYGTLVGLELTNLYRCSGEATHDYRIEAPYDGAYLVWRYYSTYWSSTTFQFHLADGVKTMREDVDNIGVHKGIYPNVDLSIGDDNGYDIVTFSDGHIQTKAFDSNNLFPFAAISQFARIAVIGDSWSSGYYYTESGVLKRDIRKFSWIANLARRNGVHWYNFAVGGGTAARWLGKSEGTTQYDAETNPTGSNTPKNYSGEGLLALLNAPACDLYFVWLGVNEHGMEHYDIGTIEDADTPDVTRHRLVKGTTYVDEPAFPDTFYGNTALILWHIANHAPKAKIVFMCGNASPSRTGTTVYDGDLNGARLAIIEAQSLPRMRPSDDWWYKKYIADKIDAGTLLGDHPDLLDNSGMALAIERLFSAVANDNRDYFRTYYNADAFGISATANTDEQ